MSRRAPGDVVTEDADHIGVSIDANVMHGQPVVAGTRIPVTILLDNLEAGLSEDEIAAVWPTITTERIRGALAWVDNVRAEARAIAEQAAHHMMLSGRPVTASGVEASAARLVQRKLGRPADLTDEAN